MAQLGAEEIESTIIGPSFNEIDDERIEAFHHMLDTRRGIPPGDPPIVTAEYFISIINHENNKVKGTNTLKKTEPKKE